MKIKRLNINSYRQFKDLSIDFTYPSGHQRAGEPLKKICLIGQSATGKTTILELIRNLAEQVRKLDIVNGSKIFTRSSALDGEVSFEIHNEELALKKDEVTFKDKTFTYLTGSGGGTVGEMFETEVRLIYFSSEIISKELVTLFEVNPIELENKKEKNTSHKSEKLTNYIREFNPNTYKEEWLNILSDIIDYRQKYSQMAEEWIKKGVVGDPAKLNRDYLLWSIENKNPLAVFCDFLEPVLKELNLEIDLANMEFTVPIRSKSDGMLIPASSLSTGTKTLLFSLFPLHVLDTRNSIILIDEPERSLFPDLQMRIIDFYQKIAPEAQFVVATHSPFVAAAFEPEERFILYFNEKGEVQFRNGESPIGDDPNDLLRNDFKIDYYNNFGKQAYSHYLELKQQVASANDPLVKRKLLIEMSRMGNKYNF